MFNILHHISANYISFIILKAGATLYKLHINYDNDQIEIFKAETSSTDKAVRQYQQLVLGGIDQVGIVKESGGNLTKVSYPAGWDLPVPTKYLIVLPSE